MKLRAIHITETVLPITETVLAIHITETGYIVAS